MISRLRCKSSRGSPLSVRSRRGREVDLLDLRWAGSLSPVAVALGKARLEVKSLTLRTPTLDDVFRELTGSHIESEAK